MEIDRDTGRRPELLYPMLVIAAVAVITFSILGIASMMGWLPGTTQGTTTIESRAQSAARGAEPRRAFRCAECALIEAMRELERTSRATRAAGAYT